MKPLPLWAVELFHPKLASSFLHWQLKECLWTVGVCRYEWLRHACLGRHLSPRFYSDLLLAFVSSEYYHGANYSLTFKVSPLINFQPGGKQCLLLTLPGSSNCPLGISAVLLLLWRARPSHTLYCTDHGIRGRRPRHVYGQKRHQATTPLLTKKPVFKHCM